MSPEIHFLDLLPAYALDCLDADDEAQITQHLAACEQCRTEMLAYRAVVAKLPLAITQATPPARVKIHLMESIRQESRLPAITRSGWESPAWLVSLSRLLRVLTPAWSMVSLILVLVLSASNLSLWQRVNQLQTNPEGLKTVALNSAAASQATGMLVISADGEHGTLVVDGLPALDPEHQYQLWLIQGDVRTNGGVFSVDTEGYGSLWISSPQPLASYNGVGITVEPAGGSPGPTGSRVLGGEL